MLKLLLNRFWSAALLLCAGLIGWSGVAHADPRMWEDTLRQDWSGIKIREGHHVEWQRASYRRADGYVLVAWSDCRTGDRDVWAQLIAPDGHECWDHNGLAIVNYPYRQEDPEVVAVSANEWVIAWIDFRWDSTGDVYAQKISDGGVKEWGESGAVVDTFVNGGNASGVNEVSVRGAPDGQGGAIIAWEDIRRDPTGDIFAQHMTSSGTRDWATVLRVTNVEGGQNGITADADGQGNMVVAWNDSRDSQNQNIWCAKVTPSGQLPWGGSGGMLVCGADGRQNGVKICGDAAGGCYLAWTDQRLGGINNDDLYMQYINSSGVAQWATDGVLLCNAALNQGEVRVATSYNNGSPDGCVAVWEDQRVNGQIKEIYAQKMNPQGTAVWTANGVFICGNAANDTLGPTGQTREGVRLTTDYAGGLICAWEDTRDSDNDQTKCDLYGARVLANGTLSWGSGQGGRLLAGGAAAQNQPLLRADAGTGIFMFYDDYSRGSQAVQYQKFSIANGDPQMGADSLLVFGLDGDANSPITVEMTRGRCGVVWTDNRFIGGGTALFYQVIDSSGHCERTVNGDTLVPDNQGYPLVSQDVHQVCTDMGGGFFVTFEDLRTGSKTIRLTHINGEGNLLCDRAADEVWRDAQTTDQMWAYCCPDGEGGCYVAWSNYNRRFLIDVYVMRMNSDCTPAWPQPVRLTQTDDDDIMRGAVPNPDHSVTVVWKSGIFGNFNVSAAKVLDNGTVVYNYNVCDAPDEQDNPTVASDNHNGAFFAWSDKRNAEPRQGFDKDIYAQHLDSAGTELWGGHNGIQVVMDTLLQDKPKLAVAPDGNVFCTWESFSVDSNLNLYAQKLSPNGTRLWPTLGKPLCVAPGDQSDVAIMAEYGNGLWTAWTDDRVNFSDVYGMHWWSQGDAADIWWRPDSGGVISDYYQYQMLPSIAHDGRGGIYCAWVDQRASGKEPLKNIWMNRINDFHTSIREVHTVAIPDKPELYQNYPNPFNPSTRLSFSIPATQKVTIEVFNNLGQRVTTLVDKVMPAGKYEVLFESPRLATGMYYYRLKTPNFVDVKKMVLLK